MLRVTVAMPPATETVAVQPFVLGPVVPATKATSVPSMTNFSELPS